MSPRPLDVRVSRPSEATNGRHIEVSALLDIDQPTHRNNGRSGLRPSDSPKGGCVEGTSARRVAGSASRTTDTYSCRLVYPSRGRYVGDSLHRVSDPHTGRGGRSVVCWPGRDAGTKAREVLRPAREKHLHSNSVDRSNGRGVKLMRHPNVPRRAPWGLCFVMARRLSYKSIE